MKIAMTKRQKWIVSSAAIVVILLLSLYLFKSSSRIHPKDFQTAVVERGDIIKTITASGTINPVNLVVVGSQVSGIIRKILVDYNDKVQKDQVLAQIDPTVLLSTLEASRSRLNKAEAQHKLAKANAIRNRALYKEHFISKVDLDQSETDVASTIADVENARSEVENNQTNLEYATIYSPVSGTVISREVNVGQTVAASFQTPTLFKIAENLTRMQIETSVAEADIGNIKQGLPVTFSVDAYPDQMFKGTVQQLRLNPTTTSNVVTYMVIIAVDNTSLKLLPGMTAYVSIILDMKKNVLRVENAALRFSPSKALLKIWNMHEDNSTVTSNKSRLYVLRKNQVKMVLVTKGLSTLTHSQLIEGDVHAGDQVITDYIGTTMLEHT